MTIKRYSIDYDSQSRLAVKQTSVGDFVSYADYEAVKKERDALTADNWNMRNVLRQLIAGQPGGVYFSKWESLIYDALNETPSTDAALAEIRNEALAEGVDMAACALDGVGQFNYANMLDELAQQLRKGAAV